MPRVKIDAVEWDDANELHATRHGVSVGEVETVLAHATIAYRNRKHRTGDFFVRGTTTGGRVIKVVFAYDQDSTPRGRSLHGRRTDGHIETLEG